MTDRWRHHIRRALSGIARFWVVVYSELQVGTLEANERQYHSNLARGAPIEGLDQMGSSLLRCSALSIGCGSFASGRESRHDVLDSIHSIDRLGFGCVGSAGKPGKQGGESELGTHFLFFFFNLDRIK